MSYRISVQPGHPNGVRRRNGQVFTGTPVEVESVTDAMRADPWLQIVEHLEPEDLAPDVETDDLAPRRGRKK